MPNQEDIATQQELLAAYRRTLAQLLKQQALISELFTPPAITNGIGETRENIRRIKASLREWGIPVEDLPYDEAPPAQPSPPATNLTAIPRRSRSRRVVMLVAGLAVLGTIAAVAVVLLMRPFTQHPVLQSVLYWSQCGSSAVWILPGTISPSQEPDHAREQLAQAIATKKITTWQVAGLDAGAMIDGTQSGGQRKLYMTVRGAASGKIDIHLFNIASVTVTTQPSSQHVDVATFRTTRNFECPSGGGGAANRTFPPTELTQQAQQYTDDKQYTDYDFLTLSSESSEVLVFPFECRGPGIYTIQIGLRYRDNLSSTSGIYSSDELATIVCPSSFTFWPITYSRGVNASNPPDVQLGTPLPYHWDGKSYKQGVT